MSELTRIGMTKGGVFMCSCGASYTLEPPASPAPVGDGNAPNELHYLKSILRNLKEVRSHVECGPSLGGEVLEDNIDWLDCYIDAKERAPVHAELKRFILFQSAYIATLRPDQDGDWVKYTEAAATITRLEQRERELVEESEAVAEWTLTLGTEIHRLQIENERLREQAKTALLKE